MSLRRAFVIGFTIAFVASGCTAQNPSHVAPPAAQPVTYYQDVAPILAARCVACHSPGNIAPFSLDNFHDAWTYTSLIKPALNNKLMPPLPPNQDGCQPLDDPRNMPDSERQKVVAWIDGGALAGDPATAAPIVPPPGQLGAPTAVYDSGLDYTSTFGGSDEYRCFVIDPQLTSTFNLIAVGVKSTNNAIVHHTIVYASLPQYNAQVDALDAADPLPGYQCFGGPGFPAVTVGAAAVGSLPRPFPAGSGAPLPAGTRYVVQVHYNFDNGRGSNRISVEAWAASTLTQIPHGMTIGNYTFYIPAGAVGVSAVASGTFIAKSATPLTMEQSREGNLWSLFPHMHQIGSSIRVDLIRADGSKSCLINIPKWDFHWQGEYQFLQPVAVHAGDHVEATCVWDNSAAHQPLVDGVPRQPQAVHFGENSTDEMCITGLLLTD
jgi:hypothetical protein